MMFDSKNSRGFTRLMMAVLVVFMMGIPAFAWAEAESVGTVEYARGAVTARAANGELRILGEGGALFEKDVLTTGKGSFAVMKLTDDSRITVRPNTVLGLEQYAYGAGKERAAMRLFKGGIRALTGWIAKRSPEKGFRLQTPTAVVGVRGTEFDARLCEGDCAEEADKLKGGEPVAAAAVAGRIVGVKGRLTARAEGGSERTVLEGGPVYEGDTLITEPGGFAVVVFRDNSRVTLQSDSRFRVDQYQYPPEKGGRSLFRLLKGGIRALSGLLAKRNANAFKIGTPTAVVGVRGTAFDLRLCEDGDCPGEQDPAAKAAAGLPAAGKIVRLKGKLTARGTDGRKRPMENGNPVYEGDVLTTGTGGFAVVVFRDDSRVTLQSGTRFKVETYRYDTGKKGSVFFRLYRGGLRVLSGWMAKRNAKSFKIGTPTAVVGVRGTLFDLISTVGMTAKMLQDLGIDPAALSAEGGAILWIREGGVVSSNAAGTFEHGTGKAVFMAGQNAAPFVFPMIPAILSSNPTPAPETIEIDVQKLFPAAGAGAPKRLYVSVRDGNVVLQPEGGKELMIGQGKTALLAGPGAEGIILKTVPGFMLNIPVPPPEKQAVDLKKLFGAQKQPRTAAGLYVSVQSGHVVMTSKAGTLHLGRGETGFADPFQKVLVRLAEVPVFQVRDPIPSPRRLKDWLKSTQKRMQDTFGIPAGGEQEECECTIVY